MRAPAKAVIANDLTGRRFSRRGEILRIKRRLEWDSFPRTQMLFLVMLTGLAGLLPSYGLLLAGVGSMAIRYPLALGGAYLVFLLLLWMWLRTKADDYLDPVLDGAHPISPDGCVSIDNGFIGGGGQSGGGGASGSFQFDDALPSPSFPDVNLDGGRPVGDAVIDAVGSADEAAVPIVILLLIAALAAILVFAGSYIVYLAPSLFAELLVDGVLSVSLYRRLRGLQTRHWLESALRRTFIPFAITAVFLCAVGYAFQIYAPQAHTLGEVLQYYRVSKGG